MRGWMRVHGIAAFLLAAAVLVGCERPFVEPRLPDVEVLSPNLTEVLPGENVRFMIRASSFREIESVQVNGTPLTYDAHQNAWVADLTLPRGTNPIVIRVTDAGNVASVDTLFGLVYDTRIDRDGPHLFTSRGGHTATLLDDGSILITGGASEFNTQATATALIFRPQTNAYSNVPGSMHFPRIGHSATKLRDGRVLIAGGAHRGTVDAVSDLIDQVEVYEPARQRFTRVSVSGRPISRAYHSATYFSDNRNGVTREFVLFFGGRGDIRAGTGTPTLGVRRDVASYEFRNDSLVYTGVVQAGDLDGVYGHSVTPLGTSPNVAESPHLIAGTYFLEDGRPDDVNFVMSYRNDRGVGFSNADDFAEPRFFHAAVPSGSASLVFGGRTSRGTALTNSVEMFEPLARRFFKFPGALTPLERRWGHSATKLADGRILLLGGFDESGTGRRTAELFELR